MKDIVILGKVIITPLIRAQKVFNQAVEQAKNDLEKDGAIQRFEFTYELVWKTLRKILKFKGVNISSPRDVFRESAREGLIEDPKFWFEAIKKRNLTSHVYDEDFSEEVFEFLPRFKEELDKVIETIKKL